MRKRTKLFTAGRQLSCVALCAVLALGLPQSITFAAEGLVICDDLHNGDDSVTQTVSEKIEADGGIAVDIRSNNNPVTVSLTGGVAVTEADDQTAIGVSAITGQGGTTNLTLSGGVAAMGPGIAYGVHLKAANDVFTSFYYVNSDGQTVPLTVSPYGTFPITVKDGNTDVTRSFAGTDGEYPDIIFTKTEDGDWNVFLMGYDANVTGWSKTPVSEKTVIDFNGSITSEGKIQAPKPITVTICTPDGDEEGKELTLAMTGETGRVVMYDDSDTYYASLRGEEAMIRKPTRSNTEERIPVGVYEDPYVEADLSGMILAQAEKACAINLLPQNGDIRALLSDATLLSSGETWAWGMNATTIRRLMLTGSNVSIIANGKAGATTSSVLGLMVSVPTYATTVELTGANRIIAVSAAAPGPGEYSGGIVAYSGGITAKAGICNVKYEGTILASGIGMVGVEALAVLGGTTNVTVIGDVTLMLSDSDGVYASADKKFPAYTPQSDVYMRGNLLLVGALGDAAGVDACGTSVIVDGDVFVSGTDDVMGIYADVGRNLLSTQGATVLVTGTVTAPTAVYIPPDNETITNHSRVYVWNYDGALDGKTENIGYVVKLEDGLAATLECASLYSAEKEGRTYYGVDKGDTVKILTESDIHVLSAKGASVPVTRTEGGYTFTMPEDCGVTVSLGV